MQIRWQQHVTDARKNNDNRKFYNALRKYGTDCWTVETLCEVATKKEATIREIELISYYDSYVNGYNATKGGDGNNGIIMSESSNAARSRALKGKPKNYDRKALNIRPTQATKDKIALSHKGMKKPWVKWTPEQISKRAMTRRSLTKSQFDEIHRLRSTGMTIRMIAESTGINGDLVKKWLKREWEVYAEDTHRTGQ